MERSSAPLGGGVVDGGSATTVLPSRAVFVVGAARSGTTLMARLLDGHPELFVLPRETHAAWCTTQPDPLTALLRETPVAREYAGDEERLAAFARRLGPRLAGRLDVSRLLRALAETWLEERPPTRPLSAWVEKTPRHLRHVPELLAAFGPQTRFVALLRDPRAVMASSAVRFRRRSRHAVRHFARRWATADELLKRFEELPQMLVVHYDDLVRETDAQMRRVARHLGVAWDDVLLTPQRAGQAWEGNSSFDGATSGVHQRSLDRWRERLQPDEVRSLENLLGDRMRAHGYAPERGGGFALARWLLLEPSVVLHLWRLRRAWRRAGQAPGAPTP